MFNSSGWEGAKIFLFSDETNRQIKSFKPGFEALLKEADALYENQRSVYSLRHLYGTFRLLYGNVDVFSISGIQDLTHIYCLAKQYSEGL